ncbi:MAG: cyclic nucleotide-binding domain-containing protein [Pseudomonadota bacterium]
MGGYLAIKGEITVGALVAALGAYKDLSSPWKELLAYYNQVQDMSLRWEIVTERFAPRSMIPEELFDGEPEEIPHVNGPIELRDVTVRDQDGNTILEDISLTIPPGARVAIQSAKASERTAMAQLLTREILPARGEVFLSGHNLKDLHQAVLAARVGYAHSRPYLFDGSFGDNLLMPLRVKPHAEDESQDQSRKRLEGVRAGNSADPLDVDWIDPGLAGLADVEDIRDWWFKLVEAMGIDEFMFRRTLRSRLDPKAHPALSEAIVSLRQEVHELLKARGLDEFIHRFDPEQFNPTVPLGGNLLFASPAQELSPEDLMDNRGFFTMLESVGLDHAALLIAKGVIDTLKQTFGRDGTDHPLFLRLGMEEDRYRRLLDVSDRWDHRGDRALSEADRALMTTVPFTLTAEQIGSSFPEQYKEKILKIRREQSDVLRARLGEMFQPISQDAYIGRLTVLENALFGRISGMAGAKADIIEDTVAEVLNKAGLRRRVASIIYDLPSGLGGNNLPTVFQERLAFSRAGIKRPDILILDKALASHDSQSRLRTRQRLRELLPQSIMLFMEDHFAHPDAYELFVEIKDGRIDGVSRSLTDMGDDSGASELSRKLNIIASTPLFSTLDPRNQRLLAFSAQWFDAAKDQVIFAHGDKPDAAYLCLEGRAALLWPDDETGERPLDFIEPGRLIGDLSIITRQERQMDLIAQEDCKFLRIGSEELRAVIESDANVATRLLETVAGYLTEAAAVFREMEGGVAEVRRPTNPPREQVKGPPGA